MSAPADALAKAVAAIGTDGFPDRFLGVLRAVAGTDLCSAFEIAADGAPRYLFSAGRHPEIPDFAESASLAYARNYWQRDRATQRALTQAAGPVQIVRQAWNGITDPDYRRACYERGGIVERLTLYAGGRRPLFASAYRTRASGHSSPAEVEALGGLAGLVLAMLAKHLDMARRPAESRPEPLPEIARRLLDGGHALSEREAAVAAALHLGRTQREISAATGIAMSSVITYRRRAYRKLGVRDRRGLADILQALDRPH
jgi:LuxR family transcriptional regulator, activator of tox operons